MEKTKVVFFWSGINSKTLKKTRSLTPQHVRETKRLQILTHHGRPLKKSRFNMVGMVAGPHESHPSTWQLFSLLYIDRAIYLQMDRSPRYRSISIQIQISRYISRSILLRARDRYRWIHLSLEIDMSHIAICPPVDLQGTFLKSIGEKKKKRIHMHVHIKTIPNDFLMILQQSNGGIWLKVCVFAK